jgi:hypothetical protein
MGVPMTPLSPSDWLDYLKYMFDQVRLQQEIRDRWFTYYLAISGAVLGVGIAVVKLFYTSQFDSRLSLLLLALSAFMFLVGICFFMIYLRQRMNYLPYYCAMQHVERELIKRCVADDIKATFSESPTTSSGQDVTRFLVHRPKAHRTGADFYTVWIHIIINSFYVASIVLFSIAITQKSNQIGLKQIVSSLVAFALSALTFEIVRRRNYQ